MKAVDWLMGSGLLIGVLFLGFLLGHFGTIYAMREPIYCGNMPCAEVRK